MNLHICNFIYEIKNTLYVLYIAIISYLVKDNLSEY